MQSVILKTATRLMVGMILVFAVYLLLRGHHEPGGGFIAALVAGTLAPGSPAVTAIRMAESASGMPIFLAVSPSESKYVGVPQTTVAFQSNMFFIRSLEDCAPPGTIITPACSRAA